MRAWVGDFFAPIAFGAALVAVLTSIRAAFVVPWAIFFGRWELLAQTIGVVAFGALGGAIGGFTYAVAGRPVLRLGGRAGPYLAGIVTVAGYITGLLLVLPRVDPAAARELTGEGARVAALAVSLFFGPIVGHQLLRDD